MVTQQPDGSVEFRFYRPNVCCVAVAGDFNDWDHHAQLMTMDDEGWWRYRAMIEPGCYQFRYWADETWYLDYAAFGLEHGPFGMNSGLYVEAPQVARLVEPPRIATPRAHTVEVIRSAGFVRAKATLAAG